MSSQKACHFSTSTRDASRYPFLIHTLFQKNIFFVLTINLKISQIREFFFSWKIFLGVKVFSTFGATNQIIITWIFFNFLGQFCFYFLNLNESYFLDEKRRFSSYEKVWIFVPKNQKLFNENLLGHPICNMYVVV